MMSLTRTELDSLREALGFGTLTTILEARITSKRRALCTMSPDDPGFTTTYAKRQGEVAELQYLLGLLAPQPSAE